MKTIKEVELEEINKKQTNYICTLISEKLELVDRINKAIEYIWSTKYEYGDLEEDNEDFDIDVYELLNILKGE